jgi:hypothetical protein
MAANNQGIIHVSDRRGGTPWCRKRNAHMSTTVDQLHTWPRVCIKCQAILHKMNARNAKRECLANCGFCQNAATSKGVSFTALRRHFDECPNVERN